MIKCSKQDIYRMQCAFNYGFEFIARGSAKSGGFVDIFSRYPIKCSDGMWSSSLAGTSQECDIDWFKFVKYGECKSIEEILESIDE